MRTWYRAFPFFIIYFTLFFTTELHAYDTEFREAFPSLTFPQAVDLQHAGDGTDRIFVVSQQGVIYVFPNDPDVTSADEFLDISDRVVSGGERGLLGLAFHPDYENNGYFYVNYTAPDPLRTVISRFEVSAGDPDVAEVTSEVVILEFDQTRSNHNGGQIAFGPDGYLYIASGDGGGAGDPDDNAQDRTNLLGAILRIDVDNTQDGLNYAIPDDNPFAGNTEGYREEIYAYGLRNPWRMSFDFETGWLWCGDVGQVDWEVIHLIENGKNYGWNIIEGSHCYPMGTECDKTGLELPLYEYEWGEDGQAITGGYVYRGSDHPDLYGKYVYGDYVFGTIWALEYEEGGDTVNTKLLDTDFRISSFGVDQQGEIYIIDYSSNSRIYTFDAVSSADSGYDLPVEYRLHQNYPNPFNNETTISFSIPEPEHVTISVFNLVGQQIGTIADRHFNPGEYSIAWNAEGLSSGVYFYRITAGEFAETKRMILLQ